MDQRAGRHSVFRWEAADLAATVDRLRRSGFAVSDEESIVLPSLRLDVVGAAVRADRLRQGVDGGTSGTPMGHPNGVVDVIAIGWATVDIDRYAADLGGDTFERIDDDPHLGAFAARSKGPVDHIEPLLLEPNTEGRLVASLVRNGEGPAAVYFQAGTGGLAVLAAAVRRAGGTTTPVQAGPLGPSILMVGGSASGPHLIAVEDPRHADRRNAETGTIGS